MSVDEFKSKAVDFIDSLVDLYFPKTTLFNRLANSTTKFYVEQHASDFDDVLQAFCSRDTQQIDTDALITRMDKDVFQNGELRINLSDILPANMQQIANVLPNKIIILKKDDMTRAFK